MFAYTKPKERLGNIQTPLPVSYWLYELLCPKVKPYCVLDPCMGQGNLLRPWKHFDRMLIGCDIVEPDDWNWITDFHLGLFEEWNCRFEPDLILANPPWNGHPKKKSYAEVFFHLIVEYGCPFVMCVPMGFRLNQHCKSKRWRLLRDSKAQLTSTVSAPIDLYPETKFHSEILIYNVPQLKPHYFLPDWVIDETKTAEALGNSDRGRDDNHTVGTKGKKSQS